MKNVEYLAIVKTGGRNDTIFIDQPVSINIDAGGGGGNLVSLKNVSYSTITLGFGSDTVFGGNGTDRVFGSSGWFYYVACCL